MEKTSVKREVVLSPEEAAFIYQALVQIQVPGTHTRLHVSVLDKIVEATKE